MQRRAGDLLAREFRPVTSRNRSERTVHRPACLLFDLDGTLLDTGPDLARALNALLVEEGRSALPYAQVRPAISNGSAALIRLGFGAASAPAIDEARRTRFLAHYAQSLTAQTALFPGMPEVLAALEAQPLPWGVVTNKPAFLTDPLLQALGLAPRASAIVSGDTLAQRKPHPAPLQYACRQIGIAPERCIYVGDAPRDIEAGRACGMTTLAAAWGYFDPDLSPPERWGADAVLSAPQELFDWFAGPAQGLAGSMPRERQSSPGA